MSSGFSSMNGSSVLLFFPAVYTLLCTPIFSIKFLNPKDAEMTPIDPIIELEFA